MTHTELPKTVGGGSKKILYTLSTLKRIGLLDSAKALKSRNACKACGLGMGGQLGGMTNERDEFPSVCNKSIQAQSTDIQKGIPAALFAEHPIADFKALSAHELEHLGRLSQPLYKAADSEHYQPINWDTALRIATDALKQTSPERSFFYASGRSSNEAGFLLQLFARLYGTNNVNNCSYYCHQATGVGLANTIGTGTATVALEDLSHCDTVFIIGANPASNHPRLIHQLKGVRDRGGDVVVINPAREPGLVRFAVPKSAGSLIFGGTEIASHYVQPRIGGDQATLLGIAKAIVNIGAEDRGFLFSHCEDSDAFLKLLEDTQWADIEAQSGVSRSALETVAACYARSSGTIFCWGMGITHHLNGVTNVEAISHLALLRGMVGRPGAGLLPLRGHSNVQGIGTVGVKPELAPVVLEKLETQLGVTLPKARGMDTLACLEAASAGHVDLAVQLGGNLYAATPDSQWCEAALDRIGFKLSLTTTLNTGHIYGNANSAQLVLPVCARDEEWEATTQESMFNYVRLSDGGITRLAEVRPESHILADLASAVLDNSVVDFASLRKHRDIRRMLAQCVPGLEALDDIDAQRQEFHVGGRLLKTPSFPTGSGRARFHPTPLRRPVVDDAYPLTLMSVRSEGQFNSIIYEEADSYRATKSRWCVLMSPALIRKLGIDKQRVSLISAHGEMRGLEVYPFDLPEDNLMAYYPEANVLIGRGRDPRSHTPAFKSVPVRLELEEAQPTV